MKINTLRRRIDQLDRRLLKLLNQRAQLAAAIGRWKQSLGQGVFVPDREEQLLRRLEEQNQGPLEMTELRAIYREIMASSRARQQKLIVGCLQTGRLLTREAALLRFGASSEFQFFSSLTRLLKLLAEDRIAVAAVPRAAFLRHLLNRPPAATPAFFVSGDYTLSDRAGSPRRNVRDLYFS